MQEIKRINRLKEPTAITLIALVITIIVLLILTAVSIATLTGDNGILKQANNAKVETRGGTVEEKIEIWKNEHFMKDYNQMNVKTEEQMLQELIDEKLVFENEINTKRKIITIGKRNISYKIDMIELEEDTGKEALILECVTIGMFIDIRFGFEEQRINNNFVVDWGDGNKENYDKNAECAAHSYTKSGNYEVKIEGTLEKISFISPYEKCLLKVKQWGTTGLKSIDFYRCESLTEIATPTRGSFSKLEYIGLNKTGLTNIPSKLFANCPNITEFNNTFEGCTGLTSIPEDLFANCLNVENFYKTFYNCTNLTGNAINLWERVENGAENGYVGLPDGNGCYYNCSNLDNYNNIPEYWKAYIEDAH